MTINTKTHSWTICGGQVVTSKWDMCITGTQGSDIYMEEKVEKLWNPEMKDDSKEMASSRHNRNVSYINTWRLYYNAQDLHRFKPNKVLALTIA